MSGLLSDDDLIHALAVLHGAELEKYNTARHMGRVEGHIEALTAERDRLTSLSSLAELDAMRAVVKAAELWSNFHNGIELELALAAYRKATR